MSDNMKTMMRELLEQGEHINGVARICQQNSEAADENLRAISDRLMDVTFAPSISLAAIVLALERKGLIDRNDVVREMDGLVSALTTPDSKHPALLLAELTMQILRREREGNLGGVWSEYSSKAEK